jgi:hypothetical protein
MLTTKQKLVLWLIDFLYYPLRLVYSKCVLDRAWLMQKFTGAKCEASYCDTSAETIDKMIAVGKAAMRNNENLILPYICEPSFGQGALLHAINKNFRRAVIMGVELNRVFYTEVRKEQLSGKFNSWENTIRLYNADFLKAKSIFNTDLTFMNPPYADRQFVDHTKHAVSICKVGGTVIGLVPEAIFYSWSWKAIKFRRFLRRHNTEVDFLGPAVCNYPVSVCMVKITKEAA